MSGYEEIASPERIIQYEEDVENLAVMVDPYGFGLIPEDHMIDRRGWFRWMWHKLCVKTTLILWTSPQFTQPEEQYVRSMELSDLDNDRKEIITVTSTMPFGEFRKWDEYSEMLLFIHNPHKFHIEEWKQLNQMFASEESSIELYTTTNHDAEEAARSIFEYYSGATNKQIMLIFAGSSPDYITLVLRKLSTIKKESDVTSISIAIGYQEEHILDFKENYQDNYITMFCGSTDDEEISPMTSCFPNLGRGEVWKVSYGLNHLDFIYHELNEMVRRFINRKKD
jgi:hypothetical protein